MSTPAPNRLTTERLVLRHWRDEDVETFVALSGDDYIMRFFDRARTRDEAVGTLTRTRENFQRHGFGLWAVEVVGGAPFIGIVGTFKAHAAPPFGPSLEIGWRLDRPHWGFGYAPEAARAAIADLFGRGMADMLIATTTHANMPSRRVMEKLGMRRDPAEDFEEEGVPLDNPARRQVLYRLARSWVLVP